MNREENPQYELLVTAHDRNGLYGCLNTSVGVVVTINDVNDNDPIFEAYLYNFTVSEDAYIGSSIGSVSAVDNDIGINARLTYSLVGGSGGKFDVDPKNGTISVLSKLDREQNATYLLEISVTDSGVEILSDYTEVEITLSDFNDNEPKFDRQLYQTDVEEGLASGTYLFTVTATDSDVGINGQVLFSTSSDSFQINETTGDNMLYLIN